MGAVTTVIPRIKPVSAGITTFGGHYLLHFAGYHRVGIPYGAYEKSYFFSLFYSAGRRKGRDLESGEIKTGARGLRSGFVRFNFEIISRSHCCECAIIVRNTSRIATPFSFALMKAYLADFHGLPGYT